MRFLFPVFLLALLFAIPVQGMASNASAEAAYDEAVENLQQDSLSSAQTTMASLFSKHAVIAIPPQLAGGTIAVPSFDQKDLRIDEETVGDSGLLSRDS